MSLVAQYQASTEAWAVTNEQNHTWLAYPWRMPRGGPVVRVGTAQVLVSSVSVPEGHKVISLTDNPVGQVLMEAIREEIAKEPCTRDVTGDPLYDPCVRCGHTGMTHYSVVSPAVKHCLLCVLEQQIARLGER